MDRKMFEAGLLVKKEEMSNEAQEEAIIMDKKRDELLADVAAKKAELAEIEGRPSQIERTAAEKEMVKKWENFLKDCFPEKQFDLSGIEIPKRTPEEEKEFTRLQFRTGKLSPKEIFQKGQELYNAVDYTDGKMDKIVANEAASDAFIWVRDNEAADEKHDNKSALMIEQERIDTETLSDRLLHELKYFKETGDHLDKKTATITSSRSADNSNAFIVAWDGGRLWVSLCRIDVGPYKYWRSRQVVSSPTKSEK